MVADPEIKELTEELRISFQLILQGRSKEDIELQDKILDAILDEVGGHKVERFCEQDMAEFTNLYLQRLGHKHINFVWAGGYIGSWMQFGTPDWVKGYIPTATAGLERDAAGGKLVQCGGDAMMGSGSGIPLGGATGLEQFVSYDPDDYESTVAGIKHMEDAVKDAASISYPPGKEFLYLQIGWTDEAIWKALAQLQAAAGVPLPAHDQVGVRPERRRATACTRRCRWTTRPAADQVRRPPTATGRPWRSSGAAPLRLVLPARPLPEWALVRVHLLDSARAFDNLATSHLDM